MDKETVSKIKHLSLRSRNKKNRISEGENIIEDSKGEEFNFIPTNNSSDAIELISPDNSDFFSQTINFKNTKKDLTRKDGASLDLNKINYSTIEGAQNSALTDNFRASEKFVKEVSRVFKKTIFTFIIDIILFAVFAFLAVNFFTLNQVSFGLNSFLLVSSLVVSVSFTTFFYILLSQRKYLFINILIKCAIFFVINFFIGQGFAIITLVTIVVLFLFLFLSYLELEKMQLGSRLFNLSVIAGECRRILITMCLIIIAIGTFNQIIWQGTTDGQFVSAQNFVDKSIFSSDPLVDFLFLGATTSNFRSYSLNSYFINKNLFVANGMLESRVKETFTFRDYLLLVYNKPTVITSDEETLIKEECKVKKIADCLPTISAKINERLNEFKNQFYPKQADIPLSSTISLSLYREISNQHYLNIIKESSKDVNSGSPSLSVLNNLAFTKLFSPKYLIPMGMVIILFVAMYFVKFILGFFTSIVLSIIWNFMKLVKFVRVDIENVESEVVSI